MKDCIQHFHTTHANKNVTHRDELPPFCFFYSAFLQCRLHFNRICSILSSMGMHRSTEVGGGTTVCVDATAHVWPAVTGAVLFVTATTALPVAVPLRSSAATGSAFLFLARHDDGWATHSYWTIAGMAPILSACALSLLNGAVAGGCTRCNVDHMSYTTKSASEMWAPTKKL